MSANDKQVGGDHYRTENDLQHWDIVYMIFAGDYLLGNASKYMARLGKKGDLQKSVEDIDKAIHYLTKKREMMQAEIERSKPKLAQYRGDLRFQDAYEL
jgi:peptidoglycan hydrolase CwlO-like protein